MSDQVVGVMQINNKVVIVYGENHEILFKADGWDLDEDGQLIQTRPMDLKEYPSVVPNLG